ncbi:MAG: hypothetical protein Ct9H90mP7_3150 [Candidatus Neomarinimicrobiota bacterium]|nr:MAG: hypothetical protein Ct9H90mP7_3150 [Candidatus Neomarinimicrobiota bacterium]
MFDMDSQTNGIERNAESRFFQIEADVAQISYEPRRAVYFPKKRPFFLDGIEFFSTPTRLIYTRKIVNPVASAKITGKMVIKILLGLFLLLIILEVRSAIWT